MYKNNFCSIWKSQGVSSNKAMEELTLNFEVFDNVVSDKHVRSLVKNEYKLKKVQSELTNMIV